MEFVNRLKGDIAQAVVRSILVQARYRVIDFGIERVVREVSALSDVEYALLRKTPGSGAGVRVREHHRVLSAMPDFVVMGPERLSLVEVKYRASLDRHNKKTNEKPHRQVEEASFPFRRGRRCSDRW